MSRPRPKTRPRKASAYTSTKLHGPTRCPHCSAALRHLPLVTDTHLRTVEVVMRRSLEGEATTSSDLAALLGVPVSQASDMLRDTTSKGLTARGERVSLPRGGMQWAYRPLPLARNYVASDTLAYGAAVRYAMAKRAPLSAS